MQDSDASSSSSASWWWDRTLGRAFGARVPTESAEAQSDKVANANLTLVSDLQTRLDQQTRMRDAYHANVSRLGGRPEAKAQALKAFEGYKKADQACRMLQGKIDSLTTVTSGMNDMRDNTRIYDAMKQSNVSTARLAAKLDVEEVSEVMAKAKEHIDDHREISEELAGRQLIDVMDEDEEYAEMLQMMKGESSPYQQQEVRPAMTRTQQQDHDSAKLEEEERMLELLQSMPLPATKSQSRPVYANKKM